MTKINQIQADLNVPAAAANDNCVQDSVKRVRAALDLALRDCKPEDDAPGYVMKPYMGLLEYIRLATFPSPEEQYGPIHAAFPAPTNHKGQVIGPKPQVKILSYARKFTNAIVNVDGEKYDVAICRGTDGVVRTSDVFNRYW